MCRHSLPKCRGTACRAPTFIALFSYPQLETQIERYLRKGEEYALFRRKLLAQARKDERVRTIFSAEKIGGPAMPCGGGRERRMPEINSLNRNLRLQAEKEALDFIIQGSASDVMKRAIVNIQRRIKEGNLDCKLLSVSGDDILLEIPASQANEICGIIKKEMEGAAVEGVKVLCHCERALPAEGRRGGRRSNLIFEIASRSASPRGRNDEKVRWLTSESKNQS